MKRAESLTLVAIVVLVAMAIFIHGCNAGILIHGCNVAIEAESLQRRQWMEFSQAHHCVVTSKPTAWNETTIWTCGDFDVRRYGNE